MTRKNNKLKDHPSRGNDVWEYVEACTGWGRGREARELTLGAIRVILASQGGPRRDVPFRNTTLSRSYGEWIQERARKEAGKISKEETVTIQVMD